jgi:hypothetical protein
MPDAKTTSPAWKILPHGPLEPLAENLWRVEGSLPDMALPRTMAVARDAQGRLLLHSAIALSDASMAELERLGEPSFLVVPNGWHRLDAPAYKARYPKLKVFCPRGARKRAAQAVPVDGTYEDFPSGDQLRLSTLPGIREQEGVLSVRSQDGLTLVFNDLLFNVPHLPGFFGFTFKLMGSTGGPRVTRLARLTLVRDAKAVRAALERLATPDLRRILPGHGAVISQNAAETLRQIATSRAWKA